MPVCPCLVQVFQPLGLTSHSPGCPTLMSFQDFSFLTLGHSSLVVPINSSRLNNSTKVCIQPFETELERRHNFWNFQQNSEFSRTQSNNLFTLKYKKNFWFSKIGKSFCFHPGRQYRVSQKASHFQMQTTQEILSLKIQLRYF